MKQYLIFANTGGEMESPECSYMHYYICSGNTIKEALDDWNNKVDKYMESIITNWKEQKLKHENYMKSIIKDYQEFEEENGKWYNDGRLLQIIELKNFEQGCWKELKWI
ncbi:MAG: hypothetical protein WCX96_04750 [Bacilli bacterium]